MKNAKSALLALAFAATSICAAGEPAPAAEQFSFCKWLPSKFAWFDAKRDKAENPYIQKFDVAFRAQYQWAVLDPNGDHRDGFRSSNNEFRRLRLGAKAQVFNDYKVEMVWNLGGANGRFSDKKPGVRSRTSASLDSFSVARNIGSTNVQIGKFKPAYIGEYRTSSSKIKTIERSAIVNQLTAGKTWGLSLKNKDKKADFGYQVGAWAQGIHEDNLWQEPAFKGDSSALLGASLNFKMGEGRLYVDYMHSCTSDHKLSNLQDGIGYEGAGAKDVLAFSYEYQKDELYFMGELIGGFGLYDADQGAENIFGLVLMPTYRMSPHFEGVFRYQLSSGSNCATTYKRYYTENTNYQYGDLMQAVYLGVNYYVCPAKPDMMKLMAGIEYVNSHGTNDDGVKGYNGWSFSTAVRVNF